MSYILDALRRAEAERERGAVPGIHAQQYAHLPDDEPAARLSPTAWAVVGVGAIAIVTAAVAWTMFRAPAQNVAVSLPSPPAPLAMTAPAADLGPAASPATAATPASGRATSIATAATSAPPARAAPSASASGARAASASPRPASAASPGSVLAARGPVSGDAAASSERRDPLPTAGATTAPASPTRERIYAEAELPDDVRRDLPKVAISGSSYSNDAASRMLMINGQIFHEGDALGSELVLDKIRPRGAVLRFRGYRYDIAY